LGVGGKRDSKERRLTSPFRGRIKGETKNLQQERGGRLTPVIKKSGTGGKRPEGRKKRWQFRLRFNREAGKEGLCTGTALKKGASGC